MILDKDQLKYITQAITPEQSTYVAQVSNLMDSIPDEVATSYNCANNQNPLKDDILFLNKLLGFALKFKDIEWLQPCESLKYKINSMHFRCTDLVSNLMPLFRNAYNYQDNIFSTLTLPLENDALTILDQLKETLFQFINKQYDQSAETPERVSMKTEVLNALSYVCKDLYEFRLAKCGADYNREMTLPSSDNTCGMKASSMY